MKQVFFVFCILLINSILCAQKLLVSQKMLVGKMAVDKEKNIVVSGYFTGQFDFDFGSNKAEITSSFGGQGSDIFIARYDSLLNYKWAFSLGSGSGQNIYGISTDEDGSIYINGFGYSSTDFDPSEKSLFLTANTNGETPFLAKYEKDGKFNWVKNVDGKLVTILNNSIYFYSQRTLYKLDKNGEETWKTLVPNSAAPVFDQKSKFYFLTDSTQSQYYHRPLSICAVDTLGNLKLKKELTQSGDSKFSTCKLYINNGKMLITGQFWGDVIMDPEKSGTTLSNTKMYELFQRGQYSGIWLPEFRNFVAEYDLEGKLIFAKDGCIIPSLVKSDKNGNVFTVGSFIGTTNLNFKNSEKINLASVGYASYIAEYDTDFNFISAVKLSEIDKDLQYTVTPYINNLYFGNGYTIMAGRFDNLQLSQTATSYSNYPEFYIAIYKNFQISPLITSTVVNFNSPNISVYPNPVTDRFTIKIPQEMDLMTLTIYDTDGSSFFSRSVTGGETNVDVSNLKRGVFFITLNSKGLEIVRKLVKK